jgi:hypothetical protein
VTPHKTNFAGATKEIVMHQLIKLSLLLAVGMAGSQSVALAQAKVTLHCIDIGNNLPDVLDSKQGHTLMATSFSCRVEGGPLDKGWATGQQVYEFMGPKGVSKAGLGVIRHPGGAAVWVDENTQTELKMQEGKVVGFRTAGKGRYTMATGAAKDLEGKSYSYVVGPTGPGQFLVEVTLDDKK